MMGETYIQGAKVMPRFRTHLKQLLLKKSVTVGEPLSQRQVAQATGLSLPTISRWYRDDIDRLEPATVGKLLDYLGCKFEDLVEFVPDAPKAPPT